MTLFHDNQQKGNTIILVTHEEDIARHAHRIVDFAMESLNQKLTMNTCCYEPVAAENSNSSKAH
jgi:ABC-type lipoprotein export system ATPase subunit